RPSDAIALAVRAKVPIYADDSVLDKAGIFLDTKTGKPLVSSEEGKEGSAVGEEEGRRLSAFYDFINTLDLEDFGKRKS
ncbi:MAG: bifunctional nuclease family protein, partial [Chloroflexi bacterium]|nr:bifunctional nuclease family protein [Chloroflexota bacterium]